MSRQTRIESAYKVSIPGQLLSAKEGNNWHDFLMSTAEMLGLLEAIKETLGLTTSTAPSQEVPAEDRLAEAGKQAALHTNWSAAPGSDTGHGHVYVRPDGVKARCGGPAMCRDCAVDLARLMGLGGSDV